MQNTYTDESIRRYEPFFGAWHLDALIARGNMGSVYRIKREELGVVYYSALKFCSVPKNMKETQEMLACGISGEQVKAYYNARIKRINEEALIMNKLKGYTNIVGYEDSRVFERNDIVGYDSILRMELLTPMLQRIMTRPLDVADVIKMGVDMCKALEICESNGVVHGNIKPSTIFTNAYGDYKLGGFNYAYKKDVPMQELRKPDSVGLAPEVYNGAMSSPATDLYSLGIVMYRLLNRGRIPHLPLATMINPQSQHEAIRRRMNGDCMQYPCDAVDELGDVVLAACAYAPEYRYKSAAKMRADLENLYSVVNCKRVLICDMYEVPQLQEIGNQISQGMMQRKQSAPENLASCFEADDDSGTFEVWNKKPKQNMNSVEQMQNSSKPPQSAGKSETEENAMNSLIRYRDKKLY